MGRAQRARRPRTPIRITADLRSFLRGEKVVEVSEFETEDPALRGEMTITITLSDTEGGTILHVVHDGLPPGVSASDNEIGWRMALDKLALLVEMG
jgi:hypothetical protein